MRYQNVANILLWDKEQNIPSTLDELESRFGFSPAGTDYFFGVIQDALDRLQSHKPVLLEEHQQFYTSALNYLLQSDLPELTLVIGVQPDHLPDGFAFVAQHPELITALARELAAYQAEASRAGKALRLVIRYASEMNDVGFSGPYNGRPAAYRESIRLVRQLFREAAPDILFSFSPALRADLLGKTPAIAEYWPGDGVCDVIGGTWYIRGDQFTDSVAFMKQYFQGRTFGLDIPCALDEIGGCTNNANNDAMLIRMFDELDQLGFPFEYATIYLEIEWGEDATLQFLLPG